MGDLKPGTSHEADKAGTTSSLTQSRPKSSKLIASRRALNASNWQRLSAEGTNVFSFAPVLPAYPAHKPTAIPSTITTWQEIIQGRTARPPSGSPDGGVKKLISDFDFMSVSTTNYDSTAANRYSPWRTVRMLEADYAAQAAAKKTKAFFEQIERRKNLKLVKMPYEILSRIVQHCADDRTNAKKVLAGAVGLRLADKYFADLILDIAIDIFRANRASNRAFTRFDLVPLPESFAIMNTIASNGKLACIIDELNCMCYDDEYNFDISDESARAGYKKLRYQTSTAAREDILEKTKLAESRRKGCLDWRRAMQDSLQLRASTHDELMFNVFGKISFKRLTLTRIAAERMNPTTPPFIPALPHRLPALAPLHVHLDAPHPPPPYWALFSRVAFLASYLGLEWQSIGLCNIVPDDLDEWPEVRDGICAALQQTTNLKLQVPRDYRRRPQCLNNSPSHVGPAMTAWTTMLRTGCEKLTMLSLTLDQPGSAWQTADLDSNFLNTILKDAQLPALHHFELKEAPITNDLFCAFLSRHRQLASVRLYGCRVVQTYLADTSLPLNAHALLSHPQSWTLVLDTLRALPKLLAAYVVVSAAYVSGSVLNTATHWMGPAAGDWVDIGFCSSSGNFVYGKRKDGDHKWEDGDVGDLRGAPRLRMTRWKGHLNQIRDRSQ